MGEIADDMIDGLICSDCGVFMEDGEAPGYPRKCNDCKTEKKKHRKKKHKKKKNS